MVTYLTQTFAVSTTRACKVIQFPKSMFYYQPFRNDQPVIDKLLELSQKHQKDGQDKYYDRIRSEGILWNYKRIRRVYGLLGLKHRKKVKRRIASREHKALTLPIGRNISWSMDFMHDTLMSKRKFRVLNIIDDYNRQALAIEADFSFPSIAVIRVLERVIHEQGKLQQIRVDTGPEFITSVFTDWCSSQGIRIQFIQPGKPMQNGFIEHFNRTYRQDVLDAFMFKDIYQVRHETKLWMEDTNNHRPHESLNYLQPIKYCSA